MAVHDAGSIPVPTHEPRGRRLVKIREYLARLTEDDSTQGPPPPPPPRPRSLILRFAVDNWTLGATVLAALLFTVRCVIVTGGDAHTAHVLLTETSLGDALRAILFGALPSLLYLACIASGFAAGSMVLRMSWEVVWLMVISIVAARLGDFLLFGVGKVLVWDFGMLLLPVLSFVLAAIVSVMLAALRPHSFPPPFLPPGVIRAFALALLIIPYWSGIRPLVEEPRFWMPHERLKFTAEAPFTGYVLNSNDDYLVILNDDPRIIIEKPKAELEERDYCYLYPGSMHYEKDFAKTGRTVPVCP